MQYYRTTPDIGMPDVARLRVAESKAELWRNDTEDWHTHPGLRAEILVTGRWVRISADDARRLTRNTRKIKG